MNSSCYWVLLENVKYINFDYNGGNGGTSTAVVLLGDDNKYTLTEVPLPNEREHYTFLGWYLKDSSGNFTTQIYDPDKNELKNNAFNDKTEITLYAKWQADTFDITYNYKVVDSSGVKDPSTSDSEAFKEANTLGAKYTYEQDFALTNLSDVNGYKFVGWFTGEGCTSPVTTIKSGTSGAYTVYGLWTKLNTTTFNIKVEVGKDENGADISGVTLLDESNSALTSLSYSGIAVDDFTNNYQVPIIYATWTYNGTVYPSGNESAVLNKNFMCDITTLSNAPHYNFVYYFVGWKLTYDGLIEPIKYPVDGDSGATPLIKFPGDAQNITLTAMWENKSTLTVNRVAVNASGTVISDVSFGDSPTVYFAPGVVLTSEIIDVVCAAYEPKYYAFKSYKVDGSESNDYIAFTENSAHTLTAYYQRYYHIIIGGDYNNLDVTVSDANKIDSSIKNSTLDVWIEPSITEMTISGKTDGNWYRYTITACSATADTTLPSGVVIPALSANTTSLGVSFEKADSADNIYLTVATQIQYYIKLTANKDDDHDVTWVTGSDGWYDSGTVVKVKLSTRLSKTTEVIVYDRIDNDKWVITESITGYPIVSKTKELTITINSGYEIVRVKRDIYTG